MLADHTFGVTLGRGWGSVARQATQFANAQIDKLVFSRSVDERCALDEVLCALQKLRRLLPAASVRDGANMELIAYLWVFSARSAPRNNKQTNKQTDRQNAYVEFFLFYKCVSGRGITQKQAVMVEIKKIRWKYKVQTLPTDDLL
jgi:hypothetical protein